MSEICAVCGRVIGENKETYVAYNGETICEDCFCADYEVCDDCGEIYPSEMMYSTEERERVCERCKDSDYYVCDNCGELVRRQYEVRNSWGGYDILCNQCAKDTFICDECGERFYNRQANWHNDYCYCDGCYEDCVDSRIRDYHSHDSSRHMYGDWESFESNLGLKGYIGIELEQQDGDLEECLDAYEDIIGEEHCYFEHDGSLDDETGVEMITYPHTLKEFWSLDWQRALLRVSESGMTSHDNGNCGLHIHISRTAFGNDYDEQSENIAKLIKFVDDNWEELVKISRRDYDQLHWCDKYGSVDKEDAIEKAKGYYGRYRAINTTNDNTIEVRMLRGTLKYESFRAGIDFFTTIVKNIVNVEWEELDNLDKLFDGIEENTIDYMLNRGAFSEWL